MATAEAYFLEGSFTWKIEEFSKLPDERKVLKYSETFEIGGYQWRLFIYPKGHASVVNKDHLSLYLEVADAGALPEGWTITASYTLIVHHQSDPEKSVRKESNNRLFITESTNWGYPKFMKLDELNDAQKGFLVEDTLTIEVQVQVKEEIFQVFTKNDDVWSLCLQFDGLMAELDSPNATSDSNQEDWVGVKEDAKQQSPISLYLDARFMSIHSKLVKGMIEDMNLSAASEHDKRSKIVIPVPKEFCPGRCSLAHVQRALGHLYLPREFPLNKYDTSMHQLLRVADYFQMRHLTLDLEDCLLNHIPKSALSLEGYMKWMLWSESFDLKRCWSALKKDLLGKKENLKWILKHKDFKTLSHVSQNDFMESILQEYI